MCICPHPSTDPNTNGHNNLQVMFVSRIPFQYFLQFTVATTNSQ